MDEDQLRAEAKQKILDIAFDFYRFSENNLKIITKGGELKELKVNRVQRVVVEAVLECIRDGRPVRFIILKARQQGVSTIVEALIYWWTITHKQVKSKIVAHDSETAEALFNMFKRYYENSNPLFQVTAKYNTRDGMNFDNELGAGLKSSIDTSSAENTGTGRGQTIHWLHGSEIAKWRNGAALVSGLMQAVPLLPNTAIFLESTANGIGDYFHSTWQAAKRGESAFKPLFFSWIIHEEYRLPVYPGFSLTKEEKQLKKDYDLIDEQLVWRREKMKEFVANPDEFFQEYPISDAEAFLASGQPRFNVKKLVEMEDKCYDPGTFELHETSKPKKGLINERDLRDNSVIYPKPLPNAPLKVWDQPQLDKEYVIGADVAEGINADYSCATVIEKQSHKTVARWRGDAQPAEFGEILEQLGRWYNRALIGTEVNNHGLTTIQRLRDLNYDNLYRREKGIDERYEEYTSKLGWRTDIKTKPLMIDGLAEAIAKNQIIDYDLIFIRECMTYVTDKRGRTNAQDGCHDDCFIRNTQILTDKGNVPIQDIRVGDLVMTRVGLKSVVATRSRFKAVIKRLGLEGTPTHPIITPYGEKDLQAIGRDDTIYTWNEKLSSIEERIITDTRSLNALNLETTTGGTISGKSLPLRFIARFGLIVSEIFRLDTTFTMPTTTHSTTIYPTSNLKQSGNTCTTTCLRRKEKRNQDRTSETSSQSQKTYTVHTVQRYFKQGVKLVQNIVAHFVATVVGERKVYNLQVADQPEYFANGILVHNCVIATAIALQLFEWHPVNERKFSIRSKFPSRYMELKQRNKGLMKTRR